MRAMSVLLLMALVCACGQAQQRGSVSDDSSSVTSRGMSSDLLAMVS